MEEGASSLKRTPKRKGWNRGPYATPPPPALAGLLAQTTQGSAAASSTGELGVGQGVRIEPSSVTESSLVSVFGIEGVLSSVRGPTPAQPQLLETQLDPGTIPDGNEPELISAFGIEGVLEPVRGWVRPCVKPDDDADDLNL